MKWIVGIDEVGRGALAGPVVVAAAAIPQGFKLKNDEIGELRDSKKLTRIQRERWADYLKDHKKVRFALARIYPRGIEKLNISRAANLAAHRAFQRLSATSGFSAKTCSVYLDGGLFLKSKQAQPRNARTVVKGDEKITAVMVASIAAKVHRDRFMRKLAKRYTPYGFDVHKGYGTVLHRKAIALHGPSAAHRLTFLHPPHTIEK